MPFTSQVTMTELPMWQLWRIEHPLTLARKGSDVTVPAQFVSDGPTIPRPLWAVWPVWGKYGRAGVVHDYLCYRIDSGDPHPAAPTRWIADQIFLEAMNSLEVGWITRHILFFGARIGTVIGVKTKMIQFNAITEHERVLGKKIT